MLRAPAAALAACALLAACDPFDGPLQPEVIALNARPAPGWYDEAKFGVFIHWGPYAIPARGEWYRYHMVYDPEIRAYHRETYGEDFPYERFGPLWRDLLEGPDAAFDPEAWADLFARAGARYVVLTTKHHDGFTLWPSATPNPRVPDWGLRRDVVGELAEAVRARGMRFGVYYSGGLDWTFRFQKGPSPVRMLEAQLNSDPERAYVEAHYRELVARYAPSVLWNDIVYPSGAGFALKWRMQADYYAAVPEGVVNDRFVDSSFVQRPLERTPGAFDLLDRLLGYEPPAALLEKGRVRAQADEAFTDYDPPHYDFLTKEFSKFARTESRKWERERTLGRKWGYDARNTEADVPTARELIHDLADIVAKNGNLFLNVGPTAEGRIPAIQQTPLIGLGSWLRTSGRAIYGTRPWTRAEGETASGLPVRFTWKPAERKVYAIILGDPATSSVAIRDFPEAVDSARLLGAGRCAASREGPDLRLECPRLPRLPDAFAYELRLE